ncbi:MAG: hypothetical protein HY286_13425 [Planctomycetes bacterium]|nr:hypothetical protein [Planctomycetota bacterium]
MPRPRPLPVLFVLLAGLVAALALRKGADYVHYYDWSRVAAAGNANEIRCEQLSPAGQPMSQWSHGPGFLFALPHILTFGLLSEDFSIRLAGVAASFVLWICIYQIASIMTAGSGPNARLRACALVFLGTHAGFYAFSLSSELFTLASLALLVYAMIPGGLPDLLRFAAGGAAAGILIITRPQLIIYALVAFAALLWQLVKTKDIGRARFVASALFLSIPFAACAWQVAVTRRWMTGDAMKSPYFFGDAEWWSVDFAHPKLAEVFFHPWHGLFIYHPIYAAGVVLIIIQIFRARRGWRAFAVATAAALALHIFHQASWYCWWLGTGSFGNRGLAAASIVILPWIASACALGGGLSRTMLFAAGLWSTALLWQGETNFYTYSELLQSMAFILQKPEFLTAIAGALAVAAAVLWRRRGGAADAFLFGICIIYICKRAALALHQNKELPLPADIFVSFVAAGAAAWLFKCAIRDSAAAEPSEAAPNAPFHARTAAIAVVVACVATVPIFLRVTERRDSRIVPGVETWPDRSLRHPFQDEALLQAAREMTKLPGYEEDRVRLAGFIERMKLAPK